MMEVLRYMVDKSSPEWKAKRAEYMRNYRADSLNKERIKQHQKASYQKHREARLKYKHEYDAKMKKLKAQNSLK